jgi:hypothetical protein
MIELYRARPSEGSLRQGDDLLVRLPSPFPAAEAGHQW